MVAYTNSHAFNYVPQVVREQREDKKLFDQLENKGAIRPAEPYVCGVCGRRFYNHDKLVNHFMQVHEREEKKRLNEIETARGKRRVHLVGKCSVKMEKYKRTVKAILTPKVGSGSADELKREGFWVRTMFDKPQAADVLLRNHMVDMMDKRTIECLVVLSDNSDFVEVLLEANLRHLKTVVVKDINDGALNRISVACFSWWDKLMGKARKEAISVVGKRKDRDVLKRLEWTYDPEMEKKALDWDDGSKDADVDDITHASDADCIQK
ncbi:hypothetical protein CUMW_241130 [Citrus unshiu]|uniref:C2H2-type domain-containing protein n=1 Tax=Citrus unshiu TaxID=55188 RepID=A0A2H5QLG2_CITUN|nr:hypothetical protein CUMW_241130 [Citrus unshiu]